MVSIKRKSNNSSQKATILRNSTILALIFVVASSSLSLTARAIEPDDFSQEDFIPVRKLQTSEQPAIKRIYIDGNELVADQAIRSKIPFKEGDTFDKDKTGKTIQAVYLLGYFQNVRIATTELGNNEINLHITVTEKPRISEITYEGNTVITSVKLNEKIEAKQIKALDEEELVNLARQIKKAYREKNYHHVEVTGKLKESDDENVTAKVAHFTVKEGVRSTVKRVSFKGNENISENLLRTKVFTREDWVLGFFDKAGTYHPDAVMQDKFTIENFYQSNGYLSARVVDTEMHEADNGDIEVTFIIDEGELYTISKIEAPGNDILTEEQILRWIPVWPGQLYSKDRLRKTMDNLRKLWGDHGYIYADVQPSIRPDEKTKTVEVTFNSDIGNRIRVNRINITGNYKTKDKILRREILFDEDEYLTTTLMEESKRRVELLGYFAPQDGVNWKIIKIDEENADLDLMVKEIKTGSIYAKMGFGAQGDGQSPNDSFSIGAGLHDTNFRGSGLRYSLSGSYAKQDKTIDGTLANDWLFDRPISSSITGFGRKTTYDDFKQTERSPVEKIRGGSAHAGFRVAQFGYLNVGVSTGYEKINYETSNTARNVFPTEPDLQTALQEQVNRSLQPGDTLWVGTLLSQDYRNHPLYPTDGFQWAFDTKIGIPHDSSCKDFAFFKFGIDANWYTPIIDQYNVVLKLHGFMGYIKELSNRSIPYRELFHVGGPSSVRGFKFGQIGPNLLGSSLGSTKSFLASAEIMFPISEDGNMRARIFYDGGAGWDTPDACKIPSELLRNNTFDFRHAIGFGISLNQPTPVRIDWGFKLDRKKKRGEQLSEVHISMSQSF